MDEVICMGKPVFKALIDEVIKYVDEKYLLPRENKWINTETALSLLNIKSRTTLAEIRDSGKIKFSNPSPKNILYDRASIEEYLEAHSHKTF